jgi:hypothetical protein
MTGRRAHLKPVFAMALLVAYATFSYDGGAAATPQQATTPLPLFDVAGTPGPRPTPGKAASPTPVPSWDATNLRVGKAPPTDTGVEPPYPGQCSSDLSSFGVGGGGGQTGATGSKSASQIDSKHLQIIVAERLLSCTQQILRSTPYQRYVVSMQQTIVQSKDCDPRRMVNTDDVLTSLSLQQWIDRLDLCANYVTALGAIPVNVPILSAKLPVVYVLFASGGVAVPPHPLAKGGPPGGGGGGGGGSGSGSGAGATQGGAPAGAGGGAPSGGSGAGGGITDVNSTIDSTSALLLYAVAITLQNHLSKTPLPSNTLVVPASLWTTEDFDTQCAQNPLTVDGHGNYSGTYGAILLDGSTTTSPYNFFVFWARGWATAKFSITVATCESGIIRDIDQPPVATIRWHSLLEGDGQRYGVPVFPLAAYAAYAVPGWSLRGTSTSTMSSISQTTGNITTSQSTSQTNAAPAALGYAEAAGLGNFLQGVSGFTIGDLSSGVTVPAAYFDLARKFTRSFSETYCDGWLPNLETVGCMREAADRLFIQVKDIDHDCRSNSQFECAFEPEWHADFIGEDAQGNPTMRFVHRAAEGSEAKWICMTENTPETGKITFFIGGDLGCSDAHGKYLTPVPVAKLIDSSSLAYAQSLYCLVESRSGSIGLGGCAAPIQTKAQSSAPQLWATPGPAEAQVKPIVAHRMTWLDTTPRGSPIRVADCTVTTTVALDEQMMTDETMGATVHVTFQPAHNISEVRVKIAPYDTFGNAIQGEDPESVIIEYSSTTTAATQIQPWIVPPHFVNCWPYAVRYSDGTQPWVAPTHAPPAPVHPK